MNGETMSEKRFELYSDDYFFGAYDNVTQEKINVLKSIDLLNSLVEENEQLRQENNMLKITIGRNELYIRRLTQHSDWHC